MTNIEKARIYRARFERLNALPKKSKRLKEIINRIRMIGLFYCFNQMLEDRLYQ